MRQVGQADVLIVNPTHIAVALQYKRGEMVAPVMLAKGAGTLAARMRAEAARRGVTVVRSPLWRARCTSRATWASRSPPGYMRTWPASWFG